MLVADEPTTALDVIVEAQILGILADLRANFDTALLLITHNLGIVAEACDRVAVMYAGRIVEEGDAREVFAEPAHPYTRELLRSTISLRDDRASTTSRARRRTWSTRRPAAASTRAARTRCRSAPQTVEPLEVGAERGRPARRLLAARPRGRRSRRAAREPLEREEIAVAEEADELHGRPTEPLLEVRDLQTHFSLRGSFLDRLRGREAGSVKAVDGVSFDLRARRGARARRRVGIGQDDAGPGAARAGRGDRGQRSSSSGERDRRPRASASCGRCAGGCRSSSRTRTPRSTRR